jgi:hypothetical protein
MEEASVLLHIKPNQQMQLPLLELDLEMKGREKSKSPYKPDNPEVR